MASRKTKPKFGAWCVYALYRAFEAVLFLLPMPVVFVGGSALGRLVHLCLPGYRNLARRNLAIAFEGEVEAKEIRRMARGHFATLGANILSSIKLGMMDDEAAAERLEIEGAENLREAAEKGKGFIYLICHMGNWEMLTRTERVAPGVRRTSLYQPLSNPYLDAHVRRRRESNGTALFDRKQGFSAPIQCLRAGGVVGVLVDQHAGDKGVWCPFFGRLASTTNLAALMGLRTGAAMHPVGLYTTGLARWKLVIEPALAVPRREGRAASEALTAEMNQRLEDVIRESPEDWFWVHNRWKTPKPAFLLNPYKRGMVLPHDMSAVELKPFRMLVRSPNWLGDACMAIPAVRAMKRGRADARITVLAPEKLADVWRVVPEVDEVLVKPNRCSVFKAGRIIREAGDFDVGILFPNSTRSALEMRRAKIPRVVGYAAKLRKKLIDQVVPPLPGPAPPRHHAEHYLQIAREIGGNVEEPEIFDEPWARPMGGNGQRVRIGICPGAEYGEAKRWPLERFGETAKTVAESHGDCEWIIFGTAKEAGIGEELSAMLDGKCRNLVGKTSLRELINELRHCEALLTNDTGTMHLAAFLGVPTIAIFGSTEPQWTGPLGDNHRVIRHHVECSPCFLRECPMDFRCMTSIKPDEVAKAVLETVGRKG